MESLYRAPFRVYLVLGLLSLIGIWSAQHLPVSLFPNSSKPDIRVCMNLELSPGAFLNQYGATLEEQYRGFEKQSLKVEKVVSVYRPRNVCYTISFAWGGDPSEATREIESLTRAYITQLPETYRTSLGVWPANDNGGFLGVSFYSQKRGLTEVYRILEPALTPKLARVSESSGAFLYNPQRREVLIELKPEAMAALNLFPNEVSAAVMRVFESYNGGSLTVGTNSLRIDFPRATETIEELKTIPVPTRAGRTVMLSDIAHIDLSIPVDSGRVFKTSGAPSVVLWADPKPGSNIKAMAEKIMAIIVETMPSLPSDIQYKVLVDPSEFIRSAVNNVGREVAVSAGLAVFILFIFVGSLRNVATAAIEIPLSIILAFILMRISGMNLNLISLGGLALSAGMNVDGSVVVMENIFRHMELRKGEKLSFEQKVALVTAAVQEVKFSVIASTIASLVVFIPLAFTSELTYAVLGDLAKAVVFSHGFSAIVALILVPTIRLHLMKSSEMHDKPSFLEKYFLRLENRYAILLAWFIHHRRAQYATYFGLSILLALLLAFVFPRLPREVIGKPDTDWLMMGINIRGNTLIRQMESKTEELESQLLKKYGDHILYTFTQINRANDSFIMFRLKDKREMESLWKQAEETFSNTPEVSFWFDSWNPAELPIPDPPDFQLSIRGQNSDDMALKAKAIGDELREKKIFDRIEIEPDAWMQESVRIRPRREQWPLLAQQGLQLSLYDLSDLTRAATEGIYVGKVGLTDDHGYTENLTINMRYPIGYVSTPEELEALPIGVGGRVLPLKALATVSREQVRSTIGRQNGREMYTLKARGKKGESEATKISVQKANELVQNWPSNDKIKYTVGSPTVEIDDAKLVLTDALKQLGVAISLSIGLIFLTMIFQFGSVVNALLVLVSVPLGVIGVLISLFVFKSTLSLNSMLGVILLNGLAVANSIILVDFLQRRVRDGHSPKQAAVEVGRSRLRPILMTSLTTGLGMIPVAIGIGEGGKILQPLGIAVAGGLCFSMITTLFIVPALQVSWLEFQMRKGNRG